MLNVVAQRGPTRHAVPLNLRERRLTNDHLSATLKAQAVGFNTAIESISQGLCFFDRNRRLIYSNRRYAEIYGLSAEKIRPGMTLQEMLALGVADDGSTGAPAREAGGAEHAATPPNGGIVHLRNGHVVAVRHEPTPNGGHVSTHEDITERWLAEAALRHGENLRAIGQMTGGIAHDLNNLLTMIGLGIENAMAQTGESDGARAELETTMRSVDSAIALLRRMASFARAQPPVPEPTDLNKWLIPLRDMAARMLGPRYLLEVRPDPELPAWKVDRPQLESAVLNLILNARDAMPEGGTITVATEAMRIVADAQSGSGALPAGSYVAITVEDNGPGMPPDVAARAFEPFFSTKPVGSGTGLGLSMVQQFARQAGGAVSLRSALGAGTSVRILLPSG